MKLLVFIKQVPMVSELPWDPRTGRLLRQQAEGMINPACRHALEAALQLRQEVGGSVMVVSMGPPQAEEALREALALGADNAVLVCDPSLAGADTLATSYTLAMAARSVAADADLILMGCQTSDSETGQVGPQTAEELGLPCVARAERLRLAGRTLEADRVSDGFLQTLRTALPALVTVTTHNYQPRQASLAGVERAFEQGIVETLSAADIAADPAKTGWAGSPSRILKVYSPAAQKKGVIIKGAVKRSVEQLFDQYGDVIGGVMAKDLGQAE